jgi:hypothetical protein
MMKQVNEFAPSLSGVKWCKLLYGQVKQFSLSHELFINSSTNQFLLIEHLFLAELFMVN